MDHHYIFNIIFHCSTEVTSVCVCVFDVTGPRPSWRPGWKERRPVATCWRRKLTPSPCASVRSFAKLLRWTGFVFNQNPPTISRHSHITFYLHIFPNPFRRRPRWERWWERLHFLWLKPSLQLETSGKNQNDIIWPGLIYKACFTVFLVIFYPQHNCNPECQQGPGQGPSQERQRGRFVYKRVYLFNPNQVNNIV